MRLLQINVTANSGSTGRIAEQINQAAAAQGWETYLAYGRNVQPCDSKLVHVGNMLQVYEHYAEHRLFDNDGLASRLATRQLVNKIKRIKPDIIHLHNIHDHWLNYKILFEYLNTLDTPIVWTQHDCWSFTGGCAHFSLRGCYRWRDGGCTKRCPQKRRMKLRRRFEQTDRHFRLKRQLFTGTKNMVIVPVSHWLEGLVRQSFMNCHDIVTIHNGIDIAVFHPVDCKDVCRKYGIGDSRYVIGVSSVWLPYKGWNDFLRLSDKLPHGVKLVLVGLSQEQIVRAKDAGIIGIPRTESIGEMAALYSGAMLFCNLTYEDTYPTTNLEAMACGTPVLTYRTGGSVEAVTQETGWIVEQGDINGVADAVQKLLSVEKPVEACRERAVRFFDKNNKFQEYVSLYNDLIKRNKNQTRVISEN